MDRDSSESLHSAEELLGRAQACLSKLAEERSEDRRQTLREAIVATLDAAAAMTSVYKRPDAIPRTSFVRVPRRSHQGDEDTGPTSAC